MLMFLSDIYIPLYISVYSTSNGKKISPMFSFFYFINNNSITPGSFSYFVSEQTGSKSFSKGS